MVMVGRCFWLGVAGLGRLVLGCSFMGPVGVAFGVARQGGWPASCELGVRLRGCVTVSRPLLFYWWSRVSGWAGVPPLLCFFFFFLLLGGLPVPPSASPGLVHALFSIPCA